MAASVASSGSGQPPPQRSGGGAVRSTTAPGLAWEFLRRNPGYRADYAHWRCAPEAPIDRRWGLRFAADPQLAAEDAQVFWLPEVAPGVVLRLERRTGEDGSAAHRALPKGLLVRAEDGLHLRTDWGLQVLVRGEDRPDAPLFVALSFDEHLRLRVRAIDALERLAAGRPPPKSHLSAAQLARIGRCLTALDGDLAGDSYRQIAGRVFGLAALAREPWKTATVRAATIRLVQTGRGLMNGGYFKLLHGGL
ncbi:DUF2285 domain-containing protein [Caulobacter endophyticus]|uniref:DUF2285 domain-containing protein n=1 Tax=Caulobacter endophyticus TaxID=2172652 RepID=A0A2T9JEG8_9CAUL|nr:DUF2285 domain-containing protein [Caulobacter endophyticus]PVM82090.1 hypothetical protein DDF67_24065 [Caulobacter endophyticus]